MELLLLSIYIFAFVQSIKDKKVSALVLNIIYTWKCENYSYKWSRSKLISVCTANHNNHYEIKLCFFLIEILFVFCFIFIFQAERDVRIAKELDLKLIYASKYVHCKEVHSNSDWLKNHSTLFTLSLYSVNIEMGCVDC